ncbi:hypothetical protein [Nocardioides sp.]|uniref:hypothetical protein n=1 Tax=Nocardioides sp. TaxID=35761 RepID=UPI0039E408C0
MEGFRTTTAAAAGGLLVIALLAGCSGGSGGSEPPSSPSASASTSSAAAYPSTNAEVTLTDPGTDLSYGQPASIAWQAGADTVGTLRISVDSVEQTTFAKSFKDWKVDDTTKTYTPYFVHAYVTNLGDTDLSELPVPLYGESSADALVEPSTFATTFKPCHPGKLPAGFTAGAATSVCLVYLVPPGGQLAGVVFRPTEDFIPITWTGAVRTLG